MFYNKVTIISLIMCWCWCALCSSSLTTANKPEPDKQTKNTNELMAGLLATTVKAMPNNIYNTRRHSSNSAATTGAETLDFISTIPTVDKSFSKQLEEKKKGVEEKLTLWSTASSPTEMHPMMKTTHLSGTTRRGAITTGSLKTTMLLMEDKLKSQRQNFRKPFSNNRGDSASHWPTEIRQYNTGVSRRINVKDERGATLAPMMIADEQGVRIQASALKARKKYQQANLHKNSHHLNKKMLNKLGFTKVKAPNSHNRKRLAIESRRHASPDDSHMFIIKLPPNMYYYSNPKESLMNSGGKSSHLQNTASKSTASTSLTSATIFPASSTSTTASSILNSNNGKEVSFPFNSNGKPGRIYHWNLPIIKKMLQDKHQYHQHGQYATSKGREWLSKSNGVGDKITGNTWSSMVYQQQPQPQQQNQHQYQQRQTPSQQNIWENESLEKSAYKKTLKRKSPTYYAPANTVNRNSFNKYFAGNGKPKGFYVIKENQKKPTMFKHIIA